MSDAHELHQLLGHAASEIDPTPGATERAILGGQRRLRRRRLLTGGGSAGVALVVAVSLFAVGDREVAQRPRPSLTQSQQPQPSGSAPPSPTLGAQESSGPATSPASSTIPASPTGAAPRAATTAKLMGKRQDVPWSEVGPGWFLANWSPQVSNGPGDPIAPSAGDGELFLVSPTGGRYALEPLGPQGAQTTIATWSGDGRRAVLSLGGGAQVIEDLQTGVRTTLNASVVSAGLHMKHPAVDGISFTQPTGDGLVVNVVDSEDGITETAVRTDLTGHPQAELGNPNSFYTPDGLTRLNWDQKTTSFTVTDNDGHSEPSRQVTGLVGMCTLTRFLTATSLAATCLLPDGTYLWSVPSSGGAATPITTKRGPGTPDLGDYDGVLLGSTYYVQATGACGYAFVARVNPNGQTTPLVIPGIVDETTTESQFLIGSDGSSRLALRAAIACSGGTQLFWFDPTTKVRQPLLGAGVNGGSLIGAILFGQYNV